MKTRCLALLLFAASVSTPAPAAKGNENLTGTWRWGSPQAGGGVLRVVDHSGNIEFQLELWRGAPSYNEGSIDGKIAIRNGKGTFRGGDRGACEIAFEFRGNRAILRTIGSDDGCGFGYDVHADGTYVRRSRRKPIVDPPE